MTDKTLEEKYGLITYRGKPLSELTREELLEAVVACHDAIQKMARENTASVELERL